MIPGLTWQGIKQTKDRLARRLRLLGIIITSKWNSFWVNWKNLITYNIIFVWEIDYRSKHNGKLMLPKLKSTPHSEVYDFHPVAVVGISLVKRTDV